jgi:hypothetical protein
VDVTALTALLAPLLGVLMKSGSDVAERASEKLGEAVWEHATRLWARLRPAVSAKPAAEEAASDLAEHPDSEDYRTVLAVQLRKLLDADPQLRGDIEQLWADRPQTAVAGDRNVVVGGNVVGSAIVSGDRNRVGG